MMKTKLHLLFTGLAMMLGIHQAIAQSPVITSFSQNGVLVCSNLTPGSVASVEWASSLTGPWTNSWAGLEAVTVTTNGTISATVPMFYRVRSMVAAPPPNGMALIPAGSFTMGDSSDGTSYALPLHTVYVSSFYMDKYKVTKAVWDEVYGWAITNGYSFDYAGSGKAMNHPVHTISWYDMVKWCNARSEKEGKLPAYYMDAGHANIYRNGQITVADSWVMWGSGYRLPTEAEWEKAARGGLSGQRFPWGDTISWSQANFYGYPLSAGGYAYDLNPTQGFNPIFQTPGNPPTSPVDYFAPNAYGLYDMAGNVWDWCWDWYGAYSSDSQTDPHGPAGSNRVLRGGAWNVFTFGARCAARDYSSPAYGDNNTGFRCVRGL